MGERGFSPHGVQDDDFTKAADPLSMMEEIFGRDDSWAVFKNRDGKNRYVFIVLGNDGYDAVSDWRYDKDDADGWNAALEAFDGELYC